jgi:hypothetical protein
MKGNIQFISLVSFAKSFEHLRYNTRLRLMPKAPTQDYAQGTGRRK